jgi:capsular polysaccharide biosynthesis protein
MSEVIVAAHDGAHTIGSVDLLRVDGAVYGGLGLLLRDGEILHEPGIAPDYFERMMRLMGLSHKPVVKWLSGILDPGLEIVRIDTPAIIPVHPHWNFGHFLMEIVPRLLVLDSHCPRDWPILMAEVEGAFLPGMVRAMCPDRSVVTFDPQTQAVRAPYLVGCGDLITPRGYLHGLRPLLEGLRDRLLAQASPGGPVTERVYLSRGGIGNRRHLAVNRAKIEEAAARAGFLVVRPETLSLPDQVRLTAGASLIAGEYGSAMHNAILARPGTDIVCLNWINAYQSQIASLMGQRIGYIPPDDGRMRDSELIWKGEKAMRFSVDEVIAKLREVAAGSA